MKYFIILLFSFGVLSCDPLRRIEMKNRSSSDAEITFVIKEDSVNVSPLYISNSTKVQFNLKPQAPHNTANLSCGIGRWSEIEIDDLVDDLESIEILNGSLENKITTQQEMKNYLMERRGGIGKRKIKILLN